MKNTIKSPGCDDYCYNFGCQNATTCPARAERIERVAKVAARKTVRRHAAMAAKTILKRVAFGLLSLMAVTGVCTLAIIALQASKP